MPEFANPHWLALLVLVPAAAWLRRAGGTAESRARRLTGAALRCAGVARAKACARAVALWFCALEAPIRERFFLSCMQSS